jgi:serine protease AprX
MSHQSPSRWYDHQHRSLSTTYLVRRTSRVLLLILVLLGGLVTQPAAAQAAESHVLPQLLAEATAHPQQSFRVIVTRLNGNRAADQALASAGGTKIKDLFVNAFVANLRGAAIIALDRNPTVKFISYDPRMLRTGSVDSSQLATLYPGVINASGLWSSATGSGWTGAGVGVAVLDTGINGSLPDFNGADGNTRIAVSVKLNSNTNSLNDNNGHGTHVAGIIAGNSWHHSDPALQGKYIGVAPEATLINAQVSDDQGMSYLSDVVNAIEWVIAHRQVYNIRVMNLSLISSVAESYTTSVLDAAVEKAWFNGIFVVVAAGNSGPNTLYYPPANDPFIVTVGAADPMATATRDDDGIAPWSSYGITQDGVAKPDVVAPGRSMVAPLASPTSTLAIQFPDRIVDGNYIRLSGTSMATPVVAGVAALAFQAHPEWTNDQTKWLLLNTSTQLRLITTTTTTLVPGQGAGEVDAAAVVTYSGTLGRANQGLTISAQLIGPDGATTYTSQSTGNWSTANWSTANWSTANWSTANWSTMSCTVVSQQEVQ